MTTITLKINEKSTLGQFFLELVKTFVAKKNGIEVVKTPNSETKKAINEVKAGKATKVSLTEFRKQLYS